MTAKRKEKPKQIKQKEKDSEELGGQMRDLQSQKDELFEKLQRLSADYANFQKRVPKQIADSAENVDAFVKGVQIIYDQMLDILKSHGVEVIKALGEKFDPAVHEAMMQKAEPDTKDNVVLEEFQKGYKLNTRVIRPSKVIVNKLPSEQQVQQQEQDEANVQQATSDETLPQDAE